MGRQRINYLLHALEAAGLAELVKERPRRGFMERIHVASANAFLVDPAVVGAADRPSPATAQGRFAAEHPMGAGAEMVRELGRKRSEAMATVATEHNASRGGRRYRVMVGGHPASSNANAETKETQPK